MLKTLTFAGCLIVVILIAFGARLVTAQQATPQRLELFLSRPPCSHPVSFTLTSSWATPFESGWIVWACK